MKKYSFAIAFATLLTLPSYARQDVDIVSQYQNVRAVLVDITRPWNSTGIQISSSDIFTLIVEGFASTGSASNANNWGWMGPEGRGDNVTDPNVPLRNTAAYSVIGKIGSNGTPFYVGRNRTLKAKVSGELFLGYNDAVFFDNVGYYVAFVSHKSLVSSKVADGQGAPNDFSLFQNYPNPFNPSTHIEYSIPSRGNVLIKIYNSAGQLIRTLVNQEMEAGSHITTWDGKNDGGELVASGSYFYQVQVGEFASTKKMILLH